MDKPSLFPEGPPRTVRPILVDFEIQVQTSLTSRERKNLKANLNKKNLLHHTPRKTTCVAYLAAKGDSNVLKNWYFIQHLTLFGPPEYCLCGDIYSADGRFIAYRQIPIKHIRRMTVAPNQNFILDTKEYESGEETGTRQSIRATDLQQFEEEFSKLKQATTKLIVSEGNMDKYFAKKKDLQAKHLTSLHRLYEAKK